MLATVERRMEQKVFIVFCKNGGHLYKKKKKKEKRMKSTDHGNLRKTKEKKTQIEAVDAGTSD